MGLGLIVLIKEKIYKKWFLIVIDFFTKNMNFVCKCGKSYKYLRSLKEHQQQYTCSNDISTPKERTIPCPHCDSLFV